MRAPKPRKKTKFVPRSIFSAAMAGTTVIPICSTACGNGLFLGVAVIFADGGDSAAPSDGGPSDGTARDAGVDGYRFSVAAIGFDAGEGGDATDTSTGDAGDASEGGSATDVHLPPGVAARAFEMPD
jgi:hypothetical protein